MLVQGQHDAHVMALFHYQYEVLLPQLQAMFPDAGLSYGYIGNIYFAPYLDDRQWAIFTKLTTVQGNGITIWFDSSRTFRDVESIAAKLQRIIDKAGSDLRHL